MPEIKFMPTRGTLFSNVNSTTLLHTGNKGKVLLRILDCIVLVLGSVIGIYGQSSAQSLQVSGIVLDPSGAVVTGAKVILRQESNASQQVKMTNQKGEFIFASIASGKYEIEAQKEGFTVIKT
jgi:hypothetical protein